MTVSIMDSGKKKSENQSFQTLSRDIKESVCTQMNVSSFQLCICMKFYIMILASVMNTCCV